MRFERQKSSLELGKVYEGKVYSITIINEDKDNERVLINVSSEAGQPGPASFATGTADGQRILNQLLDSLNCEKLEDIKGKVVRFRLSQVDSYVNTTLLPKNSVKTITGLPEEINEEELPM